MALLNIEQSYKEEVGFFELEEAIENSHINSNKHQHTPAKISTDGRGVMQFSNKQTPYQKYHHMSSNELHKVALKRLEEQKSR